MKKKTGELPLFNIQESYTPLDEIKSKNGNRNFSFDKATWHILKQLLITCSKLNRESIKSEWIPQGISQNSPKQGETLNLYFM